MAEKPKVRHDAEYGVVAAIDEHCPDNCFQRGCDHFG